MLFYMILVLEPADWLCVVLICVFFLLESSVSFLFLHPTLGWICLPSFIQIFVHINMFQEQYSIINFAVAFLKMLPFSVLWRILSDSVPLQERFFSLCQILCLKYKTHFSNFVFPSKGQNLIWPFSEIFFKSFWKNFKSFFKGLFETILETILKQLLNSDILETSCKLP